MTTQITPVFMTPADAAVFKKFQKHYTLIGLMESLGVFDITNGSVEIHFDSVGGIGSIDIRKHFKRPHETPKGADL